MQARSGSVGSLEEGKEPVFTTRAAQFKTPPLRALQLFGLYLAICIAFSIISIYTIQHFGIYSVITTVKSDFMTCDEGPDGSLDRWRKPPSNLLHSMSDKELYWRASFAPQINKYPFSRVPKIAFMFLTKAIATWVDWSRGGAHPATFGSADISEELFIRIHEGNECMYNNQPSSICFLFARKFAVNAFEPLLEIAPKVFGF